VQSTEQLKIETPEQIALELPIAGIGSRFLALAIDTVLQLALFVLGVVIVFLVGPLMGRAWSFVVPYSLALFVLFLFCLYWGYFACFEIIWKGQSPGKRLARIRVIKESGRPITAYEAIGRNLVRVIDFLPVAYAAGIVCMLLNRYSRRLGDYVAGTVVVHDRRTEMARPDWRASGSASTFAADIAPVPAEELVLIETYLQRRLDLDSDVRESTARQIAGRVTARTGLRPESDQHLDDFLESVARQVRDAGRFR